MKFLCICQGGTVRSGALAWALRYRFDQRRVIVASWEKTEQEDLDWLASWADYIIVMQPRFADKFTKHSGKIRVLDVGEDRWNNPLHHELQQIVTTAAQGWASRGWRI